MFGKSDKPAMSGPEMMLRSMGLGEAIDMSKQLAADGTFKKILDFAAQVGEQNKLLAEIKHELECIRADRLAAFGAGRGIIGEPSPEPRSDTADSGLVKPGIGLGYDHAGDGSSGGRNDAGRIAGVEPSSIAAN